MRKTRSQLLPITRKINSHSLDPIWIFKKTNPLRHNYNKCNMYISIIIILKPKRCQCSTIRNKLILTLIGKICKRRLNPQLAFPHHPCRSIISKRKNKSKIRSNRPKRRYSWNRFRTSILRDDSPRSIIVRR